LPTIPSTVLAWNESIVVRMAKGIYGGRLLNPALLAILADAAEDAGLTDAELLGHLRSAGPHYRGCWPLDLLLGKG
jgi:hypothetical protein